MLVRLSAPAWGDGRTGDDPEARGHGCEPRARRRHTGLLRQHRPREADEARGLARLGSSCAEAAEAVAACGSDGRRARGGAALGDTPGRCDLSATVEHLPARPRQGVDTAFLEAGDAGALCRRLCRAVQHGKGVRGGRSQGPRDPEPAGPGTAPGQDEASRSLLGPGGFRLPRLHPAEADERADLGEGSTNACTSSSAARLLAA